MISARVALVSHAREFFNTQLPGIFPWDAVKLRPAEPLPRQPNGRRNPLGKYAEIVTLDFDHFLVTVESSEQEPPLGWIRCTDTNTEEICEGPLDVEIWANIGRFIRERVTNG